MTNPDPHVNPKLAGQELIKPIPTLPALPQEPLCISGKAKNGKFAVSIKWKQRMMRISAFDHGPSCKLGVKLHLYSVNICMWEAQTVFSLKYET